MDFRSLATCILVFIFLVFSVESLYAQSVDFPEIHSGNQSTVVTTLGMGEELRCLAVRSGHDVFSLAVENRILKPTNLPSGTLIHLPNALYTVKTGTTYDSLIKDAVRLGSDAFILRALNPVPLYPGGIYRLPVDQTGESGAGRPCLPFPLVSLKTSKDIITRGETMIVVLETASPVICEVQYLGRKEPCYAIDETHFIALLGISALEEAGMYKFRFVFATTDAVVPVDLHFEVSEGHYGYQYINPPASLYALLDEKIYNAEERILEPYREIRTPFKMWEIPLGFPLTLKVPISADYGDRRSYGGMFDGYHSGVDYRAWINLPVLSPADGVVILSQTLKARGNAVLIDHGWGLVTGFWHLSSSNVEIGQTVSRGEIIGKVGNTGLSTGSHLHWETWVNGVSVDGKQWLDAQEFSDISLIRTD